LRTLDTPGDLLWGAVAFAADSRHLAVANTNGTVYVLRLAEGPGPVAKNGPGAAAK
jgi:hypothetical protein